MTVVDLILVLISFVLGILSSVGFWYVLTHRITPRISFSEEIAQYKLPDDDWIWLAEVYNDGKRRIVDVEIVVRVAIKGYKGTKDTAYHTLVTNASYVPRLGPGRKRKIRLFDTRDVPEFRDRPSRPLREAIEAQTSFNEVLRLGEDAWAVIYLSGYDEVSGARKIVPSHEFRVGHIRKGTFRDRHVASQSTS